MISEDAVECFPLRRIRSGRGCNNSHAVCGQRGAGSKQFAVDFHHAGVACLDRPKLGVIANLRNRSAAPVDRVNQALAWLDLLGLAIDGD
jgi:hypothetical protein